MQGRDIEENHKYLTIRSAAAVNVRLPEGTEVTAIGPTEEGEYGMRFPAVTNNGVKCLICPKDVKPVVSA